MKRKILIIFFLLFPFFVSAYTKEDIISLVSNKKLCDSTTSNMYETYLNTYTRILNSKDINEELSNQIYEKIAYSLNTLEDNKVCKIVRGPIPNSAVYIVDEKSERWKNMWHRANDELLTIKEAKALGKEYEDKGYKVHLHLSEF